MKKYIASLILASTLLLSFQSCEAQKKVVVNREVDTERDGKMLLGQQNADQFQKVPYSDWYLKEHAEYAMDKKAVEELRKEKLNTFNLTVFVGTWCEDSHREFPRLMKILEAVNYPEDRLTIIGVNRKKESPAGEEGLYNIQKVPTVIVSKHGKQLGRIIEYPQSGYLERDLLEIIKKHDPNVKDLLNKNKF